MLHYILVRHGESVANVDKSIRLKIRECDIPLTETGADESVDAGTKIYKIIEKINDKEHSKNTKTVAIVSPYLRARETYHHIETAFNAYASTNSSKIDKHYEDARLRELDYGVFHARTDEQHDECKETIRQRGGVFYYQYPNGESYTDLMTRLSTLNNEILGEWRDNSYQTTIILMVAHAHVLAAFDILLLKKHIGGVDYKMPNCTIRQYYKNKGKVLQHVFSTIHQD